MLLEDTKNDGQSKDTLAALQVLKAPVAHLAANAIKIVK